VNYIKKNIILFTVFTLLLSNRIENIPIEIKQPDGQLFDCLISGDEYYQRLHDSKNFTIIQKDDGYYYYGILNDSQIIASQYKVNEVDPNQVNLTPGIKISKDEYLNIRDLYWRNIETRDAPSIGTINNLNVFIRFSDEDEFTNPRSYHDDFFNNENGPSMYHYFKEVSYELLNVHTSHYPQCDMSTNLSYQDEHPRDYYQPYNETSNPIGYQNNNQARVREHTLLKNAIEFIANEVPENLDIDANDDGYIDNVTFLVSGSPGAWADLLWPHRWVLYSFDVYINDSRVYDYNLNLDQGGYFTVGTLCHEFFHSLGAPDLYHYYDDVSPVAVGGWDVMDASSDIPQSMSAYMKYKYTDWITYLPEVENSGTYELNPLSSSENNIYRINSPLSETEYFVVEYRVQEGIYEINTPGDQNGILIYRVNSQYSGNANGPPDELYLYRVGGTINSSGSFGAAIFNQEVGRTEFNDMTNPSCFLTDGSNGGINISYVGEDLETIQFSLTNLILVSEILGVSYDTDNDGNINPGEEVIIDVSISNLSDGITATNIIGQLSTDADIEIINPEVNFSNYLITNDSAIASFVLNIDQDIQLGDISLNLNIESEYVENNQTLAYSNQSSFEINVNLNQPGFPYQISSQVSTSPIVADINSDSELEIIFADFNGKVHVINSDGEEVLTNVFPYETGNQIWGSPAMDDLNNDGIVEFIFTSKDKNIYTFNSTGLLSSYNAESQLIGTPSIGNIDDDSDLEIIVGGFSSSGKKVYAINHDGTSVANFPININEKIQKGISLFDFDENGKEDMVFGTENNNIYLLYDSGEIADGFPFEGDSKFRVAPIIINYNESPIIVAGSKNGTIYGIDYNAQLLFEYQTNSDITTSPSINIINDELYIFFGNAVGDIYAIDINGNLYPNFPFNINHGIIGSIMFEDLDSNGNNEIIIVDEGGFLNIYNIDLNLYQSMPIEYDFSFFSSPLISDIDQDGDLEIIAGTVNSLFIADIKQLATNTNSWNIFRGNYKRNGFYTYTFCYTGDLNNDGIVNVIDIISLVNIIIGQTSFDDSDLCNGDLTQDGIINVQDIISLINFIVNE